jgi:hypothetical protein
MAQPISQEQKAEWIEKIRQQKESGKQVIQWCKENQIHPRMFYYWRARFFPKIIDRSCFTELKNCKGTGVTLEYQGIRICLDKHFDLATLKDCLTALSEIKC